MPPLIPIDRSKPYSHISSNGIEFKCARTDLTAVIKVNVTNHSTAQIVKATAEFIGWWAANIREDMIQDGKGWSGYDCLKFEIKEGR